MGAVWAAEDPKLRRAVAIKLLSGSWGQSEDARKRFEREAMAVAQLQCPQVVQIFDYGLERDVPFIVMELLEGEDLQKRLKKEKRLTIEDAVNIVWHTAKALGVAHAAGIIHRDLKPGNVFLVRQGDEELVKVLDFGVAKTQFGGDEPRKPSALVGTPQHRMELEEGEGTKVGTLLGTPQYMSPEQANGVAKIDHRADLWSLAVIAFRMVTGKLPYNGRTAGEVIAKVTGTDAPKATSIAPDLPFELDNFFERAFARSPDARFSSARDLARAFSAVSSMSLPTLSVPEPRLPLVSGTESWPDMLGQESGIRSGKFTPPPPSSTPGRLVEEWTGPTNPPSASGRLAALQAETTLPTALPSVSPPEFPAQRSSRVGTVLLVLLLAVGAVIGGAAAAGRLGTLAAAFGLETPETAPQPPPIETAAPTETAEPVASEAPPEPTAPMPATPPPPEEPAPVPTKRGPRPRPTQATPAPVPQPPAPAPAPAPQPQDPFAERL